MNSQRVIPWILYLFAAVGIALNIAKLVYNADVQSYFVDEILNDQAALNFFREGNYSGWFLSGKFPAGISSGIVSTWISGLVFLAGGNLFLARLMTGLFIFFQLIALIFLFARRRFSGPAALAVAVILTSMIFHFPYWFGFMQSMGEMQGALLIGWGLLILGRYPWAGFFLFGLAVWHCKFMYMPMTAFLTAAYVLSQEGGWKKKLATAVQAAFMIMLSQMLWAAFIWFRFDLDTMLQWLNKSMVFVTGGHSGMKEVSSTNSSLAQRLTELEWATLSSINRLEILTFFFMPLLMMIFIGVRYLSWRKDGRTALMLTGACLALILYAYWYFFISPSMWVKQIQPGLYLGFALIFFLAARIRELFTEKNRAILEKLIMVTVMVAVAVESFWVTKSLPLIQPQITIARACDELFNDNCYAGNEHLFRKRPY